MFSPVYVVVEYACSQPAVPSGNRFPISDLSSGTAPVILEYRVFSPHSPFVPPLPGRTGRPSGSKMTLWDALSSLEETVKGLCSSPSTRTNGRSHSETA